MPTAQELAAGYAPTLGGPGGEYSIQSPLSPGIAPPSLPAGFSYQGSFYRRCCFPGMRRQPFTSALEYLSVL